MLETVEGRVVFVPDKWRGDHFRVDVPGLSQRVEWADFLLRFRAPDTGRVPEELRERLDSMRDKPEALELAFGPLVLVEARREVVKGEIEAFPETELHRRLRAVARLAFLEYERPYPQPELGAETAAKLHELLLRQGTDAVLQWVARQFRITGEPYFERARDAFRQIYETANQGGIRLES